MNDQDKTAISVGIGSLAVILIVINFLIRSQMAQPLEILHSAVFLICFTVVFFSFKYALRNFRRRLSGTRY